MISVKTPKPPVQRSHTFQRLVPPLHRTASFQGHRKWNTLWGQWDHFTKGIAVRWELWFKLQPSSSPPLHWSLSTFLTLVSSPCWKGNSDSRSSSPHSPHAMELHTMILLSPWFSNRGLKWRIRSDSSWPRLMEKLREGYREITFKTVIWNKMHEA